MRCGSLFAGVFVVLVLSMGCNKETPAPVAERVIKMSDLLGHVDGAPPAQKLDGFCTPVEDGTELRCDIYNGLQSWDLTAVTIAVIPDLNDHETPARYFQTPAFIPSLSTRTVNVKLGTQVAADTIGKDGTHIKHWDFTIVGAKGIPTNK